MRVHALLRSVVIVTALFVTVFAQAQQTWTWIGGTADVADANNWSLSSPGGQVGPPGLPSGPTSQVGRIASFGATGSATLMQANLNYWLEQFVFQPDAHGYTYTATDAAGYLSLAPAAAADINAIDNKSTSLQIFNMPIGGKLGYDGFINTTAGGGDVIINGPVAVADDSGTTSRWSGVTGSGNIYFNVDSNIHPNGNVNGGAWTASAATGAYNNNSGRFFTDNLSGRAYFGDIGTAYRGTFHLTSTAGGKVQLTHDNALGDPGTLGDFGGTGTSTAVVIYGGNADTNPATGFNTTLELSNNINVRRSVMWMAPRAGATIENTPHISNVSGNNTLSIGGDWNTFGTTTFTSGFISGNWNIESQNGNLTIAGGTGAGSGAIFNTRNVNVNLQLMGDGNGRIDAPLLQYQSNPSLNLVKKGGGTWTLTNIPEFDIDTNTKAWKGTATVNEGTLALSGTTNLGGATELNVKSGAFFDVTGLAGGSLTLNSSNLMLKGNGTINGTIVASTGNTIAPGDSIGTLHFGAGSNLTLNGGSTLEFELTPTPTNLGGMNDQIVIGGNLSLASFAGATNVQITPTTGTLGSGTYTLMTYAGSLSGSIFDLNLQAPASGRQAVALNLDTPNQVNLIVTGAAANLTWTGAGDSTWVEGNVGPINWTGHATDNHFYNSDNVTFATTGTSAVTISGTVSPSNMNFTNEIGKNYTLSGGSIDASGSATFTNAGDVTFSNTNLSVAGTFALNGTGTVTLANTGTLALPSTVAINSGTLVFDRFSFFGDEVISTDFTGAGTLRIETEGVPTVLSGNNSGFTGTTVVASGSTLKTQGANALTDTVVLSGATIDIGENGPGIGTKSVSIVGSGVSGVGAITVATAGADAHVGNLTLTGDAKISASGETGAGANRGVLWVDGAINGGGFNLHAVIDWGVNNGSEIDFINNGDANLGDVTITGGGSLYLGGNTSLGSSGAIILGDGSTGGQLGLYGSNDASASTVPVTKDIVVTAGLASGLNTYNGNSTIDSDITMNGDLEVNTHPAVNGQLATLTLNGKLTGSGGLTVHRVGTSSSTRNGMVELTSNDNDYSGITTIGGGGGIYNDPDTDRITLSIGNGGTTGSIGPGDVINHWILRLNRNDTYTLANNMYGGAGDVVAVAEGGDVTLSGAISTTGVLQVSGGTVRVTNSYTGAHSYRIGYDANTEGTLVLDSTTPGAFSTAGANGHVFVGRFGTGHLQMVNGDLTVAQQLSVGDDETGVGDVNHVGGNIIVTSDATVGWLGEGSYTMNTATGSLQMLANFYVGRGGTGVFRLIDGTVTASGNLVVGAGTVTIGSDQTMTVAGVDNAAGVGVINVGGSAFPEGDYNMDGIVNAIDYVVWRDNPSNVGGGNPAGYNTWRQNFGSTSGGGGGGPAFLNASNAVVVDTLNLNNGTVTAASVSIDTELAGNGTIQSSVFLADAAVVDPGTGADTIEVTGDMSFGANSVLEIGVNPTAAQVDLLDVDGLLTAAGSLNVSLIGAAPALNTEFTVLNFGTFGGGFTVTSSPGSGTWDLVVLANEARIKYISAMDPPGSATAVPEPGTLALLALGVVCLLRITRNRVRG